MADNTPPIPLPLASLLEESRLPLLAVDSTTLIARATNVSTDLAPFSLGTPFTDWIHPNDRAVVAASLSGASPNFWLQVRVGQPGGWHACHIVGQRCEVGRNLWLVTCHDITEKWQNTRYLEAFFNVGQRFQLSDWVFHIATGVHVMSPATYALFFGERVATPQRVSHEDYVAAVHPDDRLATHTKRQGAIKHETTYQAEYRVVWKTGEIRWVSSFGAYVRDVNDEPVLAGFSADLTAARKQREELLQIERLRSLGILAGGVAHDFNNKLAVIMGHLSLLEPLLAASPLGQVSLDKAQRAAEQARDLAQQLLVLSRHAPLESLPFPVAAIVDPIREWVPTHPRHRFSFNLPADLWAIEGDRTQLRQVIDNIVRNALEAMPDGGSIDIAAENVWAENPVRAMVELTVGDSGPGIPVTERDRLFDPFFSTKSSGHGLGLASAHAIVRRHRGALVAEASPCDGALLRVQLPARPDLVIAEDASAKVPLTPLKGTVLIVDDDGEVLQAAQAMAEFLGLQVHTATTGDEALGQLERHRCDVVILDWVLTGKVTGQSTWEGIRTSHPEVPVIISTGYANVPLPEATPLLPKPYTPRELAERLTPYLSNRKATASPGAPT